MSRNFKIDGSLNVENLVITKDLEVKGNVKTVESETLTVKDNFITINGEGSRLDVVGGLAGTIVLNGKEKYKLKNGKYRLNAQVIFDLLEIEYEDELTDNGFSEPFYGIKTYNHDQFNKFYNLGLYADEVDDLTSYSIAREIKEKIENEMQYPGTIKVTVIRETRATEEAK